LGLETYADGESVKREMERKEKEKPFCTVCVWSELHCVETRRERRKRKRLQIEILDLEE
jgi:hypothetical protein